MRTNTVEAIVAALRNDLIVGIQTTIEDWQEKLGAEGMYDIMPVGDGKLIYDKGFCEKNFVDEGLACYLDDKDSDPLRFSEVDYMEGGGGSSYDSLCLEDLLLFAEFIEAAEFGLEPL